MEVEDINHKIRIKSNRRVGFNHIVKREQTMDDSLKSSIIIIIVCEMYSYKTYINVYKYIYWNKYH